MPSVPLATPLSSDCSRTIIINNPCWEDGRCVFGWRWGGGYKRTPCSFRPIIWSRVRQRMNHVEMRSFGMNGSYDIAPGATNMSEGDRVAQNNVY